MLFNEIVDAFSERLLLAVERFHSAKIEEPEPEDGRSKSPLRATLESITAELDSMRTVTGKPLEEHQKDQILNEVARKLGLEPISALVDYRKGASNQSYVELVRLLTKLIRPRGKR
jgi:hypothetical protein